MSYSRNSNREPMYGYGSNPRLPQQNSAASPVANQESGNNIPQQPLVHGSFRQNNVNSIPQQPFSYPNAPQQYNYSSIVRFPQQPQFSGISEQPAASMSLQQASSYYDPNRQPNFNRVPHTPALNGIPQQVVAHEIPPRQSNLIGVVPRPTVHPAPHQQPDLIGITSQLTVHRCPSRQIAHNEVAPQRILHRDPERPDVSGGLRRTLAHRVLAQHSNDRETAQQQVPRQQKLDNGPRHISAPPPPKSSNSSSAPRLPSNPRHTLQTSNSKHQSSKPDNVHKQSNVHRLSPRIQAPSTPEIIAGDGQLSPRTHGMYFNKRWMPCADFLLGDGCANSGVTCRFKHPSLEEFENTDMHIPGIEIQENFSKDVMHVYLKEFFSNNIFKFGSLRGAEQNLLRKITMTITNRQTPNLTNAQWHLFRDPLATRLLDLVDEPNWKNKGSRFFKQSVSTIDFRKADQYRYYISNICIKLDDLYRAGQVPDWDWPLKIDWQSLPNLEYLQLDLRAYSEHPFMQINNYYKPEDYQKLLKQGAKAMRCLNLKRLTLIGLCSYSNWGKEEHERQMDALFRPAVRKGGIIVFLDAPLGCTPLQPIRVDTMGLFKPLPGLVNSDPDGAPRNIPPFKWLPVPDIPIEGNLLKFSMQTAEGVEPENNMMRIAREIPLNWSWEEGLRTFSDSEFIHMPEEH